MDQAPTRAAPAGAPALPRNIFRYVLATGWLHQLLVIGLTVAVFLIELVPLELQRRIVNDLAKDRAFDAVVTLCAIYLGVILVHGSSKLGLNVYRGWIGERATRDLRKRIRALVGAGNGAPASADARGIEVSMIVAEVEPIGAFAGYSLSEPLLQAGVLLSVLAYMTHLDAWMALVAAVIFAPQLVFVPLVQGAIVRRTASRVQLLRGLSVSIVADDYDERRDGPADDARIERVFVLDMGIFRLKFTLNFLMNLCNHLQVVAALLLGGWLVLHDRLEIGGVVAFISGVARLNDPWGDLVNYFRDMSVTNLKFRLVADAVARLGTAHAGGVGCTP